jgi:hypothetical protein
MSKFTFSWMFSDKLSGVRPGMCDGVVPLKSGSVPGHKNARVRSVRMSSCPFPCFSKWRNNGKVLAIIFVKEEPVIARRHMTNLLSGGKSAIRSSKSMRHLPHCRSGDHKNPVLDEAACSPSCSTGMSIKGRVM